MKQDRKLPKILGARELRRKQTPVEEILWQHLRNRNCAGKKFRRQHAFCGFVLDFYCPENKLAIELDGPIHAKQQKYDIERQAVIEANGVKMIRFKNSEVLGNMKKVLLSIKENLTLLH